MMSSSNLCICRIPADWSFMNTVTQKLTRLKIFTAVSFILTAALGTACHFAFDFFGQSRLIAPFVPVNESTWEHLKLLFFPFLLLLVIGCFAGIAGGNAPISNRSLKKKCFYPATGTVAAFGELCGMAAVVVLFYGINGILGFNLDWVNIAIYFMLFYTPTIPFTGMRVFHIYNTFSYHKPHRPVPLILPVFVLVFVTFLFMLFTFYPPHIGLFSDPAKWQLLVCTASLFTRYSYPSMNDGTVVRSQQGRVFHRIGFIFKYRTRTPLYTDLGFRADCQFLTFQGY